MRSVRGYVSRHRSGVVYAAIVALCFLLMILTAETRVVNPKRAVNTIVSLVQRGFAETGRFARRFFSSIGELRQLRSRYSQLQEELISYRRDERELIQLRRENEDLRALLEISGSTEYRHRAAEVIGNDPSSFFNAIIIDKGSLHGIGIDMPVVAYQDGFRGLVGRVIAVGPISAQVLPVFDANCYVTARLQNQRYTGLVQGGGDRFSPLTMSYVPKSARDTISLGDLIASSGQSSIYPKDVYVGRVRGISAKSWEASLTLELAPIIDFSRLEYVFVLEPNGSENP